MSTYEIKTETFAGPIEKLLSLIEERELDITRISLAEVTSDFLKYVRALESKVESHILADFIVVAARLLLIKSRVLLPSLELTEEEETEIQDLESRLRLYREYKAIAPEIQSLWMQNRVVVSRPFFLGAHPIFYPPPHITTQDLFACVSSLFKDLLELQESTRTIRGVVVSLEEKMKEILERLQGLANHRFTDLAKDKPREEIIVLFLALLQLIRDQAIHVEQKKHFDDMIISTNPSTDLRASNDHGRE